MKEIDMSGQDTIEYRLDRIEKSVQKIYEGLFGSFDGSGGLMTEHRLNQGEIRRFSTELELLKDKVDSLMQYKRQVAGYAAGAAGFLVVAWEVARATLFK